MDGDRELTIWLAETFGIPLDYCDLCTMTMVRRLFTSTC